MKKIYFAIAFVFLAAASATIYYQKTHRKLLVTGTARSGTQFITDSLRAEGLRIGHERMGGHGVSGWDLAAGLNVGRWHVRRKQYTFDHIFHQVRHPLKVISSVYVTEDDDSWNYILAHTPEIRREDPHLVKCAKYWYYWNLKAEEIAEWTYRVEEIDNLWEGYGARLGKKFHRAVVGKIPKNTHAKKVQNREFTWEDLQRELDPKLYQDIQDLARKYGYAI